MRESVSIEFWFNSSGSSGGLLNESDGIDFTIWEHPVFRIVYDEVEVSLPGVPAVKMGPLGFRLWHHVAMTYDHRTQTLCAYLDGQPKGSSTGPRATLADRPLVYMFGHTDANGDSYSIAGGYDEFRLWDYARAPEQIAAHWDKVMVNDTPGLVALWHFDSLGISNTLSDSTPGGAHPGIYYPRERRPTLYPSTVPVPGAQPFLMTEWTYPPPGTDGGAYASFGAHLDTLGAGADTFFEWGPNLEFGNSTPVRRLAPAYSEQTFYVQHVGPIAPGSYNARAVAILNGKRYEGLARPFSITSPMVATGEFSVTNRMTRLFATAHRRQHAASIYFEWGPSFEYSTPPVPITDSTEISFKDEIHDPPAGLIPYRAVLRFETGVVRGDTAYFTIAAPSVLHLPPAIDGSSATLRLLVHSNGFEGTTFFEWGSSRPLRSRTLQRSFSAVPVGLRPNSYSWTLTDLSPGEYFAQPVLIAGGVEYRGEIISFTTTAPVTLAAPSLAFSMSDPLGEGARRLRVDVNPHLLSGSLRIQSGRDGTFTTFREVPIAAGSRDLVHFEDVFGIEDGPAREFRVVASNAVGETISQVLAAGRGGWAGSCYGLVGRYLETARPLGTNFSSPTMTIELWFNPSRFAVPIASERSRGTNPVSRTNIEILASGEVRGRLLGMRPLILGSVRSNEWSHAAVRYDAASRTFTGFLNGNRTSTNQSVGPSNSRDYFIFGQPGSSWDPYRLPLQPFAGYLDEVRIWNIARSDLDLTANRGLLLAGDEPGLVLNWRLDARTVMDESPRGNRGVVVGNGLLTIGSTAPLGFGLRQLAGAVELQFLHYPGAEVLLEFTEDFSTWQPDIPALVPSSGRLRVERAIDVSAPRRLYRIVPRN